MFKEEVEDLLPPRTSRASSEHMTFPRVLQYFFENGRSYADAKGGGGVVSSRRQVSRSIKQVLLRASSYGLHFCSAKRSRTLRPAFS